MMEDDLELANRCEIGYLTNLFLGFLISFRYGSVLGMNIYGSQFSKELEMKILNST